MQTTRRATPYPWTWEIPAAALTAALLLLVLASHAARSLANGFAGAGWDLTPRAELFTSLPALITGDARAGLPPGPAAAPAILRAWLVAVEALTLAALILAVTAGLRRWGPARLHGMATRAEAETLLGRGRLRRAAPVIRPDRYTLGRRVPGRMDPTAVGWRLGRAREPHARDLWVPWDRTTGVIGPQGSGKTLELLTPALLTAPGAALVTLTKADDLLLSIDHRATSGRPCVVLDPFGLTPGLPELVWDPVDGCVDPLVAERRAKAFTAGTVQGAGTRGQGEDAARFYAAEAAKVIQGYLHAAALTGRTLEHVLRWVASPLAAVEPVEILREHPHAAPYWHGLLHGALRGDDRTAGNTITTVQQALGLFFQEQTRRRCTPGPGRPATDVADLITRGGTIYLLGRDSPYESASPLMTAVAEHVLDTALALAAASPWGRLCPPLLACLDELPSTAPLPTLQTRMANDRALGISFIWAAQTRAQLTQIFGEHQARAVLGLTNVLTLFGGSKDVAFNQEISELLGPVRVARTTWQTGRSHRSVTGEDIPILTGAEIRQLPERRALVIAEHGSPLIATLNRCIDGRSGQHLLAAQAAARGRLTASRSAQIPPLARASAALIESRRHGIATPEGHPA